MNPLLYAKHACWRPSAILLTLAALSACATPPRLQPDRLADAMAQRPVVLLGEVHDNLAQHAARAAALKTLLERGARPALAFEQLDRERQADIDRARQAPLAAPGASRVDALISQGADARNSWDWSLYRPYLELALAYDLPIVAANLSRADARKVAREGFAAVFNAATIQSLGLDRIDPAVLRAHEQAVDDGHCNMMPPAALRPLAQAQIARDATLLMAIRPHLARGVVLLTGNGHARADIGVAHWMTPAERARTQTIGLLEEGEGVNAMARRFDVAYVTPRQRRADPCESLRQKK